MLKLCTYYLIYWKSSHIFSFFIISRLGWRWYRWWWFWARFKWSKSKCFWRKWSEYYTSLIIMYGFIISSHIFEFKYLKNLFICLVNDTSLSSLFRLVCPWSWRKKTQIGWISLLEHLTMFCCNYDIFCM